MHPEKQPTCQPHESKQPRGVTTDLVENSWVRKKKKGRNGTKKPMQTPWRRVVYTPDESASPIPAGQPSTPSVTRCSRLGLVTHKYPLPPRSVRSSLPSIGPRVRGHAHPRLQHTRARQPPSLRPRLMRPAKCGSPPSTGPVAPTEARNSARIDAISSSDNPASRRRSNP